MPHKLREEFVRLGHHCDALFADDIGVRPRQRHARDLLGPSLAAGAIAQAVRKRGVYDVIDVAGGEGAAFASLRRTGAAGGAALISRSNGLEHLNYARLLDDAQAGLTSKPWPRRIWYPIVRLRAVRRAIAVCDRLVVLNERERDYVVTRGWKPGEAVDVVSHGVSDRYLNAPPPPSHARGAGVLFCGTWNAMKGVPYLAAAFAALRERPVRLTVLGGGQPEKTILAAFAPEARSRVSVLDRVPEHQVIEAYRRHDMLVMCSTYEGFGMVVPEAMSQGLPVVATPVGAARTLVRDGETGLIVPPRDSQAIAAAICRLLDDSELRARLAESARRAVAGLSWSAAAHRTLEVRTGPEARQRRMRVTTHLVLWGLGLAPAQTQTSPAERRALAAHAVGRSRLVEIGVWHGVTTALLGNVMDREGVLWAVDPFPRGRLGFSAQYDIARRVVGDLESRGVRWVRATGVEAAAAYAAANERADFVFFDGDHSYDGLAADWRAWSPLVAPGGIVCLHDSRPAPGRDLEGAGSVVAMGALILPDVRFEVLDEVETLTVLRRRCG